MKRPLLLVLALFFTTLAPQLARAQATLPDLLGEEDDESTILADSSDGPQRIGIPAASFDLESGESGAVAGYCFDEHLIAPMRVTNFENILAGNGAAVVRTADGRERPLRDAVRHGEVDIKAHQLQVAFVNRTTQPMQVRLNEPMVLWDRPAGQVNPLALAALGAPNASYDARQKAIWKVTNTERRLHALGYLEGSMYDYDRDRLVRAVNAFQRDNGLTETSDMDLATIQRAATVDGEMRNRLRALGFSGSDRRYAKEALAGQIRAYEKFLGRPATGRWSENLGASLASTETLVPQLNTIRPTKGQQVADVLAGDAASSVLTYVADGRSLLMLTTAPSGVELWNRAGRSYQFAGRGDEAVRRVDQVAASLAQRASKPGRLVIYPGVGSGTTTPVTLGDRTLEVDSRQLASFVGGGEIPAALRSAIDPIVPAAGASQWTGAAPTPTLVVYRSPLQQGRARDAVAALGLEQVDAAKLAGALDRTYGGRMSLYVSNDLRIGADRFGTSMGSRSESVRRMGLALAE